MPAGRLTRGRNWRISWARGSGRRPRGQGAKAGPKAAAAKRRAGGRKRAPRGSVPRFVERALRDRPGSTVQEILALAATDAEPPIKPPSIRTELRNGRKQGKYESRDGRWSLAALCFGSSGRGQACRADPRTWSRSGTRLSGAPAGDPAMETTSSPEPEGEGTGNKGRLGLTW